MNYVNNYIFNVAEHISDDRSLKGMGKNEMTNFKTIQIPKIHYAWYQWTIYTVYHWRYVVCKAYITLINPSRGKVSNFIPFLSTLQT